LFHGHFDPLDELASDALEVVGLVGWGAVLEEWVLLVPEGFGSSDEFVLGTLAVSELVE
jgi:hypothetical protein